MKKLLVVLFSVQSFFCFSQKEIFPFYSKIDANYTNSSNLKFLDSVETNLLNYIKANKKDNPKIMLFDAYSHYSNWRQSFTLNEIPLPTKEIKKTNDYELYMQWNNEVNAGRFIGFSREYNYNRKQYVATSKITDTCYEASSFSKLCKVKWDTLIENVTTPIITIPVEQYKLFLSKKNLEKLEQIAWLSIKEKYSIEKFGNENISRSFLPMYSASIDLISNAQLAQFKDFLMNLCIVNKIKTYAIPDSSSKILTSFDVDNSFVYDNTIVVNGSKIPYSEHLHIKDIILIEKWDFMNFMDRSYDKRYFLPASFLISKQIYFVGLNFSDKKQLYFLYDDIKAISANYPINFNLVEQYFQISLSNKMLIEYGN